MCCARFQVKHSGFASFKSPNSSMVHDKGALLPPSTKASSVDDSDSKGSDGSTSLNSSGSAQMSARHLPPIYVDIQEEIETNLDEIGR